MRNILITGSNGFLGKYFYYSKMFTDYNVIWATTSRNNKEQTLFSKLYSNVNEVLDNVELDSIVHLASVIPVTFGDADSKLFIDNVQMMSNLADFALKRKINKIIYTSGFGSMNIPQSYDIRDYYTLSKVTGEHLFTMLEYNGGPQAAILRITSPFGEYYHAANVLRIFVDAAILNKDIFVYGKGSRTQNFIYAGNILDCVRKCLENKVTGIYDLAGERNVSMVDLAELIVKLTKSKSKIITGFKFDPLEDNILPSYNLNRLYADVGYKEIFSFEESLMKFINWRKKEIEVGCSF